MWGWKQRLEPAEVRRGKEVFSPSASKGSVSVSIGYTTVDPNCGVPAIFFKKLVFFLYNCKANYN